MSSNLFYNPTGTSKSQVIWRGIRIFLVTLLIFGLIKGAYLLLKLPNYELPNRAFFQLYATWGQWPTALFMILIWPLVQETAYRLWLSFKRWDAAIGLGILCILLLWTFLSPHLHSFVSCLIICVIGIAVGCAIGCFSSQNFWDGIRNKYGTLLIWLSILLSGFIPLAGCADMQWRYLFVYLVLIPLPFMIVACVSACYRLSLGFIYGVLFHIVISAIGIAVLFL